MENKSVILTTAIKLFSEKCYEGVGIQQVAREAGVTKPTVYHYFSSKQGLMEAILEEWGRKYLNRLLSASQYSGDVMTALKTVAGAQLAFANEYTDFYRLLKSMYAMSGGSDSNKMAVSFLNEEYKIMEELFYNISLDHGNIGGRFKIYAATFMGMLDTFVDLSLSGNSGFKSDDGADLLHRTVHQFMHGIFS